MQTCIVRDRSVISIGLGIVWEFRLSIFRFTRTHLYNVFVVAWLPYPVWLCRMTPVSLGNKVDEPFNIS